MTVYALSSSPFIFKQWLTFWSRAFCKEEKISGNFLSDGIVEIGVSWKQVHQANLKILTELSFKVFSRVLDFKTFM